MKELDEAWLVIAEEKLSDLNQRIESTEENIKYTIINLLKSV